MSDSMYDHFLQELDESDHQISSNTLRVRWYGFDDGVLDVTYRVGLGSETGLVNVRDYEDAGHDLEHEFQSLLLNETQVSCTHYYL